ncbi:phage holin family protein [Clostridium sp. 'deep sea']|uniref:phage holin family protein n=1 Tax=Clostridium sp. 'deep sea' TaxID=2779445 RepID=UPI001896619D|nr:phage holin family protein [Clostridium sp. 'deep sea']QOR34451.1 phage holin family protein [Clostridium sp. 'deep sea']
MSKHAMLYKVYSTKALANKNEAEIKESLIYDIENCMNNSRLLYQAMFDMPDIVKKQIEEESLGVLEKAQEYLELTRKEVIVSKSERSVYNNPFGSIMKYIPKKAGFIMSGIFSDIPYMSVGEMEDSLKSITRLTPLKCFFVTVLTTLTMAFNGFPIAVRSLIGLSIITFITRVMKAFRLGEDKAVATGNAVVKLVWTYLLLCAFFILSPVISEDYLPKGTLFIIGNYVLIYNEVQCIVGCANKMGLYVPEVLKKIGKKDVEL